MATIDVINQPGAVVGSIELNDAVFGIEPHQQAMYDALVMQMASRRQGTADTKGRSEVSGGGRKPYRQKGTGRARQGSTRAPHWPGGGIVFGPHPRSYSIKMNRKERRLALKSALAYKAIESKLVVVDNSNVESSKTKYMKALLSKMNLEGKILIVTDELTDNLILSTRNLSNVLLLSVDEINTYDIVYADTLVITEKAVKAIEEVLV